MTAASTTTDDEILVDLRRRIADFLAAHDPTTTDRGEFLRARYDAGLAWISFPAGLGGLGLPRALQPDVDDAFAAAGAPDNNPHSNGIGLGMAAPTILAFGTAEQHQRFLRPLWTGEEIWCQLFSEPGAGSDLAGVSTRAVKDDAVWIVNGQKVWTSNAHNADWGILLARTDPEVSKHAGLTYFLAPMKAPGVEIRPLRQITGEAEFNEVFLSDVRIDDDCRLGDEGAGWKVATTTLNNERVFIGAEVPRESGMIGVASDAWREHPELRTSELHARLMELWVESEAARLTGERVRQKLSAGQPGPEGSVLKLCFARLAQEISGLELELLGEEGLRVSRWDRPVPEHVDFLGHDAGYRYLRAKGNSIEGGTSEILKNVIAERVLGLPSEPRVDVNIPWKQIPVSDLSLLDTDTEADLRSGVRDLLSAECDPTAVIACYDGDRSSVGPLWTLLSKDMGLSGLLIPEELGGAGGSAREAAVVLEELGRTAAPVPFLTSCVIATTVLLGADGGAARDELLAGLGGGGRVAAFAVPLSTAPFAPPGGTSIDGADRLTGRIRSVAGAIEADDLLVPVETPTGTAVYLVEATSVRLDPVASLDMTRQLADLTLDGASGTLVVAPEQGAAAVNRALMTGAALLASEQIGVAGWCLNTTVDYLKQRRQFGRQLGSFQALKHRLADVFVANETATATAHYAAATVAADDADAAVATAVAQAWCGDVAVRAAEAAVQLHGGIGMTWEHPAHLYLKRAKADQIALGSSAHHRAQLAELVDLPGLPS